VFIEKSAKALACLRQNLTAVCKSTGDRETVASVRQMDALTFALSLNETPDLVFIDPPYELIAQLAPALFARLRDALAPKPDALVCFELPGELTLQPEGWTLLKRLGKGARQPTIAIYRRSE
jgi:16S rRNA (guanine966-N2)-methyltransferase